MAEEIQPAAAPPVENNDTDAQEWANAAEEFQADHGITTDPAKPVEKPADEPAKPADPAPAKPAEDPQAKPEPPKPPENETEEQKVEREKKEAEEAANKPEEIQDNPTVREQRSIQRQAQTEQKAMSEDIRKTMFSEVQTELTDADGDPIRTVADVQKLMNPNTGKPFTPEEATMYLFEAQKHLDNQLKEVDGQVEQITETNITLKDEADNIRTRYGELLKNMPALAAQLHNEFQKTLVKDEKTGIITKAPVSLESFYEIALTPYVKYAARLETEEAAKAKAEAEAKAKRTQSDRTDIYAGGKSDTMSPDEREWAAAAKDYYEG